MLEKIRQHFASPINKKAASITALVLIVLAIPLTVFISQQQQELRQRAQEVSTIFPFEKAAEFYGTTDHPEYISISNNLSLENLPYQNFTIEAWVKPEVPALPQSDVGMQIPLVVKSLSSSIPPGGELIYSSSIGLYFQYQKVRSANSNNDISYSYLFTFAGKRYNCRLDGYVGGGGGYNSVNPLNTWTHVVGVLRDGRPYLFINGRLANSNPSFDYGGFCTSTEPILIGSAFNRHFQGLIDEVRLSSIARYTSDFPLPATPFACDINTIALWHLDSANANIVDSCGAQVNNGNVVGNIQFVDSTIADPIPITPSPTTIIPPSEGISLALSPSSQTVNLGSTFSVTTTLHAGTNNITGIDTRVTYNKDVLEIDRFEPSSNVFDNQLINTFDNQTGVLRYAAVNTQNANLNGDINIGTLTLRAKAVATTSQVTFENVQVTALGQSGALANPQNVNGLYTIVAQTPTSAPTAIQTPQPIAPCATLYNRITRAMGKSCGDDNYDSVVDLNRDRRVSSADYSLFLVDSNNSTNSAVCENYLNNTTNPCAASPSASPTPIAGDANGDRAVDILDFNIWRDEFLGTAQTRRADFNRDGRVDLLDFAIWRNAVSNPSPTPTSPPQASAKRVFVTSTTYNGNLGGLTEADFKCQERASATNLSGRWKAWLSDSTTSAASRFRHYNGLYKLTNGVIVANNWADLTDGSLQNPITIDENGSNKITGVWTNTKSDGTQFSTNSDRTCANWTAGYWGPSASRGINYNVDHTWTDYTSGGGGTVTCQNEGSIYCFEQ